MPNYLSVAAARDYVDQLQDALYLDPTTDAVNEAWISQDIDAAEGVVDGHLSARYAVPVSGAGASAGLLTGLTRDLWLESAYRRLPGEMPAGVKDAAKVARETLMALAKGEIRLGGAVAATEHTDRAGSLVITGDEPRMTRDKLKGF